MLGLGLMIPFAGTALGSATVFLMKGKINKEIERLLLGFASGVMLAASVWSLLLPSIDMAQNVRLRFIPASSGFLLGAVFLISLDKTITRLRFFNTENEKSSARKSTLIMALAVTLHNIPEGMAVGVALAAAMNSKTGITLTSATALSVGIAIQNFPEGAIISMPLKSEGAPKGKAFLLGTLSGAVEPLFGILTVMITGFIVAALPYLLSFAAGAMVYVVAHELIPEARSGSESHIASAGLAVGFVLMMSLDVCFG